ncbi:MAG TPA: hypothetical protein VK066_29425 [Chloroflexota bacterium]|nr:hypothetical protein [Chloroflexota bacterium]
MAERGTLPSDQEVRAYMHKLKAFRDSLAPTEQRMLDAVVLAAYWPEDRADTHGYGLPMPTTIYDDTSGLPPIQMIPWGKVLGAI